MITQGILSLHLCSSISLRNLESTIMIVSVKKDNAFVVCSSNIQFGPNSSFYCSQAMDLIEVVHYATKQFS